MNQYLVVAADAVRARFFHLQGADEPALESGPNLVEDDVLLNPEQAMSDRDVFSENKSGRNRTMGSSPHGYDDHRDKHADENARKFARLIAKEIVTRAAKRSMRHIVLSADKRMLGMLRPQLDAGRQAQWEIRECAADVSKLAPDALHHHLAGKKLLPPRRRPGPA